MYFKCRITLFHSQWTHCINLSFSFLNFSRHNPHSVYNTSSVLRLSPWTCSSGFVSVSLWQIMCRISAKACVNHVVYVIEHLSLMQQWRLSAGLWVPVGSESTDGHFSHFIETAELRKIHVNIRDSNKLQEGATKITPRVCFIVTRTALS